MSLDGSPLPPLRIKLSASGRGVHAQERAARQRALPGRGEPRLPGARRSVESRATSSSTLHAAQPATLIASTETIETMSVLPPRELLDAERGRRRRLLALAGANARRRCAAELVLAADQFIITPAGRTAGVGARPRLRRRSPHRDRRLSLVHRLGPRHDDQPRRADADDRPSCRGRLHPADLRALRARRADPEHVSRKASAKGCTTPPTRRSGSSTPIDRYVAASGDRLTLALLYPTLKRIVECARRAARASGSTSTTRDGLLVAGRRRMCS